MVIQGNIIVQKTGFGIVLTKLIQNMVVILSLFILPERNFIMLRKMNLGLKSHQVSGLVLIKGYVMFFIVGKFYFKWPNKVPKCTQRYKMPFCL